MKESWSRICSVFLVMVMLFNMIPSSVLAENITFTNPEETATTDAQVVGEVVEKRTEYTKEYIMDNGFYIAAVYDEPVHFEEDGHWKEIDNTLVSKADGTYANTDGVWDVRFPQTLSQGNHISITKDGYTLSFGMAGELRNQGNLEVASADASLAVSPTPLETASIEVDGTAQTFAVSNMQIATAQIQELDVAELKASVEHEELVLDKNASQLMYNNVYSTTDIRYDLQSNKVKESVILESYDSGLRGYRYTLNVGELEPMLFSDGSIRFFDEAEKVVMSMPAPFLVDNNGEMSTDVQVSLTSSGSTYTLVYLLPQTWLASSERAWPVVLDPVVQADPNALTNIKDRTVASNGSYAIDDVYLFCGYGVNKYILRTYIMFSNLPELSSSDVIVSADLMLRRTNTDYGAIPIEAHKVLETWTNSTLTWGNRPDFDTQVEDYQIVDTIGYHTWNITDVVRGWYAGENTGVMFKADDATENAKTAKYSKFYSSDTGIESRMPTLTIYYRNNNGLESYWDYTSASAGRAGTGYVNSYTGNMVWTRSDMGFGGNLMPVSISHIYNLNDSNNNEFGMGYGWRSNYNQRVYKWSQDSDYYVWEDSDGTEHVFYHTETSKTYKDEDGLELTLKKTGSGARLYKLFDKTGNTSYFDTNGRLTFMENNQETKSSIAITYVGDSLHIDRVTDGAGRVYTFHYNADENLEYIKYWGTQTVGGSDTLVASVRFQYNDGNLTAITDNDSKSCTYGYLTDSHILSSGEDIDGYKLQYSYYTPADTYQTYRVSQVESFDGGTAGGSISFAYAHNQTTFTDHNGNVEVMQFNDFGNTVSIQDGQGRAQYAKYAVNSSGETGKSNQLTLSSKLQNTVVNLLQNSSFESEDLWTADSGITVNNQGSGYLGSKSLKLTRAANGTAAGVQTSFSSTANTTYTFSAYVKIGSGSAYLQMWDGSGSAKSTVLFGAHDWTRLEVTYTAATENLKLGLMTEEAGTVYMDCVQLEAMPAASRYNLVQNGDFRTTSSWSSATGQVAGTSAAPHMDATVYKMTGSMTAENRITQTVPVSGAVGDTFVLAGWGKGDSVPLPDAAEGENQRYFAIIGEFHYTEDVPTTEENEDGETVDIELRAIAQFNPDSNAWQYVAQPMVAKGAFDSITITLAYDYNANTACFDGIQLFKEEFGSSYTYDDDGNVTAVKDIQGQTTSYEYSDNDLTKEILPTGAEMTYTYDDYHNVKTATTEEGLVYNFDYDQWGNNTSVSIVNGSTKITSTADYSEYGNYLESTTDATGNITRYGYDPDTNVLKWVQYPEDTEATQTSYTYDSMFRMASAAATTDQGKALSARYTYTDDLLTKIETGNGTAYTFDYGDFSLRESIQVGSRTLASYEYTDDQNKYLDTLAYGNGDSVKYDYDDYGRVIKQAYEDQSYVTNKYDNNGALATVTDSASGISTTYYYDFTERLMKYVESRAATETQTAFSHGVGYEYDEINNLTALVETINGTEHTTSYVYDDDNRVTSVSNGDATVTYTYDAYGRIQSQATTYGINTTIDEPNVVTEDSYTFTAPTTGSTSGQIKSHTVTMNTREYVYVYTYDGNGNITSVTETVVNGRVTESEYTTSYVYDSSNQLLRENNEAGGYTHVWTYDNAGNILSRTEYAYTEDELGEVLDTVTYTYGDTDWGDLLTAYDGQTITYDTIGNPLSDGTWTYEWQHGRQLESMSTTNNTEDTSDDVTWTYTYNADGLRIGRTDGTSAYSYVYNGSKLTQMTLGSASLYFSYDASGLPMTVTYDADTTDETEGTVYHYVTNIQGDIIAILDTGGGVKVVYTYDAWGNLLTTDGPMAETLGTLNPLRYRSYVYDQETQLYYLQSRYYNPEIGRFINADAFASTGQGLIGNNMFTYCLNNPTTWADPSGCKPGDYFQSVDEAARDAAIYIGWRSFLLGWEYATSIYAVTVTTYRPYRRVSYSYGSDGTVRTSVRIEYIATTHTLYTYSSIWTDKNAIEVVPPLAPHGYELEAFVHTHPLGSGQGITRISDGDKSLAKMYGIPIYAYGPNGQLCAYDPESGEDILIYDDLPEALIKHWKYYRGEW